MKLVRWGIAVGWFVTMVPALAAADSSMVLFLTQTAAVQEPKGALYLTEAANPEVFEYRTRKEEVLGVAIEKTEHARIALKDAAGEERNAPLVIAGPPSLEVMNKDVIDGDDIRPDVIKIVKETALEAITELAQVSVAVAQSDRMYALTGVFIPTQRRLLSVDGDVITEETRSLELAVNIDNERGRMIVGGLCADTETALALFQEKADYLMGLSPAVHSVSSPCVTGTFEFEIASLPDTISPGIYYLAGGDVDSFGEWRPASALTEIEIFEP